ncbi:hypothetical protein ASG32_30760 [Methylobacterium sp. Leaf361]|nr:hypothetical protein ASG32_30760 [Methylobacterium sp. Leaf361]
MRPRPTYLRLVSSREPGPDQTRDDDLTEIAAGLADVVIAKANTIARAATLDDVNTVGLWMFGHATHKVAELREVIRRCWIMVSDRQEASRRLAAGRSTGSRKAVAARADQDGADRQLAFEFEGAA